MRLRKQIVVLGAVVAIATGASAHDSPEHEIEALTAKMAETGKNAELLARRATEWRALGKLREASADLREAVKMDSNSVGLLTELARVETARENYPVALKSLERALNLAENDGAIYMARAEVLESKGDYAGALKDCERAFSKTTPLLEWHLTRARLAADCGKHRESAKMLKEAFEQTGSVVLEIEWIEAMIEVGESNGALERIAPHLARARWKSGWLVRQARAHRDLGNTEAAQASSLAALAELARRISPEKPDLTLIAERGLAHVIIGKRVEAENDFNLLRTGMGNSRLFSAHARRLERALGR
jgi:tetratricopeptide (TPR) repeat protein